MLHGTSLPSFTTEVENGSTKTMRYSSRELSAHLTVTATSLLDDQSIYPDDIRDELSYGLPTCGDDTRTERFLQTYFFIMDELFFKGLLGKIVRLEYNYERNTRAHAYFKNHRQTSAPTHRFRDLKIICQMGTHRGPYQTEVLQLIVAMDHEMVHAFLDIFSCPCEERCEGRLKAQKRLGLTGHGDAWQTAMDAVAATMVTWPSFEHADFNVNRHRDLEMLAQRRGMALIPGMPKEFPGFDHLSTAVGGLGPGANIIPDGEDSDPGGRMLVD
jgi:hypothetical protein